MSPHSDSSVVGDLRVMVYVEDLNRARHFYGTIIGWPVLKDFGDGVMFEAGAKKVVEIFDVKEHEGAVNAASTVLSLEVTDVRVLHVRLQDRGASPLRHNDWGDTSFFMYGPEQEKLIFFTRDKK